MKRAMGCKFIGFFGAVISTLFLVADVSARRQKDHPYRHSDIDIPVSLAAGTVRTPEFIASAQLYTVMVQIERPATLSPLQIRCMMGLTLGPQDSKDCSNSDPLLRADWAVLDGDQIIARGSDLDYSAGKFEDKHVYRYLGTFTGKPERKLMIEVKFTKDAASLNVANPRLIVIQHRYR